MYCIYCGKQIDETSRFCQYCGSSVSPSPTLANETITKANKNTASIIGLALALVGIAASSMLTDIGFVIGIPAGIASIILCSIHMKQLSERTISIFGLALGIVGVILSLAIAGCVITSAFM